MYEMEWFITGLASGILLVWFIYPKIILPKLRERFGRTEKPEPKRTFRSYKCEYCRSGGRHRLDCPNNPKNKKVTQ